MKVSDNMAIRIRVGNREYKSYAAAVKSELGLTKEEYTKQYDVFKHRVRNYITITGDKVSAAKEFFFKKMKDAKLERNLELLRQGKQPYDLKVSKLTTALEQTSARTAAKGKYTKHDYEIAKEQLLFRFQGMADKNLTANEIRENLENDLITVKEAKKQFEQLSETMKEYKSNHPDMYASDSIVGSP